MTAKKNSGAVQTDESPEQIVEDVGANESRPQGEGAANVKASDQVSIEDASHSIHAGADGASPRDADADPMEDDSHVAIVSAGVSSGDTADGKIMAATLRVLKERQPFMREPNLPLVAADCLKAGRQAVVALNGTCARGSKWTVPQSLTNEQIATIFLFYHRAVLISDGSNVEKAEMRLGIYHDSGPHEGTYVCDPAYIEDVIAKIAPNLKATTIRDVMSLIRRRCGEPVPLCRERDLVPVNNGVFDYETKTLRPFDPNLVFTSKCAVDFVPDASCPSFTLPNGEEWDVESWVQSLFTEHQQGVPELIWEIIGAFVRPNVMWKRLILFISSSGNNGKGTLCELIRNVIGPLAWTSIPLAKWGEKFALVNLPRVQAVIVDENDTNVRIDSSKDLKSAVTGDAITVNRKYRDDITMMFVGLILQCLNEQPSFADRSNSLYRRQLPIQFERHFNAKGAEVSEIKEKFLKDRGVLEYVLWRVLVGMDDYYKLSEPDCVREALEELKLDNDNTRLMLHEVLPMFEGWDFIPKDLLYEVAVEWTRQNNPKGVMAKSRTFFRDVRSILAMDEGAEWVDATTDNDSRTTTKYVLHGVPEAVRRFAHFDKDPKAWDPASQGEPGSKIKSYDRGLVRKAWLEAVEAAGGNLGAAESARSLAHAARQDAVADARNHRRDADALVNNVQVEVIARQAARDMAALASPTGA